MTSPLVSICINNFDYDEYVGSAIRSALAQRGVATEVIVVDDGSSDGSEAVIAEFEPEITFIQQENGGQAAAINAGFCASRGDVVIFLDADDELEPTCAARVAAAMAPGVAKVHWRLRLVDAGGVPFGFNPSPRASLASGDVSGDLVRTGWYSTVPMSGNGFPRWVLERLMPVPEADFRRAAEPPLLMGAAFLGPVVAIDEALTRYRLHDRNAFAARGSITPEALRRRLDHARVLDQLLPRVAAQHGVVVPPGRVLSHPDFRLMELLERRGDPDAGLAARVRAGLSLLRSVVTNGTLRPRRRVLLGLAGAAVPIAPRTFVNHLRDVALAGKPMASRRRSSS